ncbi:MarR family transcriptional regulator [Pseudomonas fluorescens]|uniref:MarR family winged helix-turn-helix transcriptional regulator n=1 Tax=Pseudomonas fluorescens TaxID=294 RepID=UPI002AC9FF90|nr:MarR family transcriptional regulator [Pseudomonas fluorescens]MDZ5431363.1 MarR family transcriptional regulator [Pseudomonas fluorescens]
MNDFSPPPGSPEAIAQAWSKERPDLNHDGLAITLRIRSLAMLIDRYISEIADDLGLDHKDLMLLFALRRSGTPYCMRPTDVFRLLRVTSGAATYRADRLVEKGVAQRIYDPEDRRSQLIQLSSEGMRIVDIAIARLAETSLKCLDPLSNDSEELDKLGHLLHVVEAGWLQATPTESNPLARSEKTSAKNSIKAVTRKARTGKAAKRIVDE